MGFNLGTFAGGAADGYRKQMEEQRKKEAADREKKAQDRQDKEWARQDEMQAELDAAQKAWDEKYNPENQRRTAEEQQNKTSSGALAHELINNPPQVAKPNPMLDAPKTDAEILQSAQPAPIAPPKSIVGGMSGDQAMRESLTMPKPVPQPATEFKPTQPTFIDRMNYMADRVAIKAKYGKASEGEQIQMYQTIKTLKDEGVDNAVAKIHAGDIQGALQDFNDVGQYRGAKLVGEPQQSTYKVGGQDMPTTIVTLALPDGTQQTINTAEYGMARIKLDKAFQLSMEGQRVGLEGERVDLQREANAETAKNNTAKLGLEWWKAKNPAASGETTSEIKNVNFLIKNGIAKDAKEAWTMVSQGKTPQGYSIVADGYGGVILGDKVSGRLEKVNSRGEKKVMREADGASPADRFKSDPAMAGNTAGKQTEKGIEVFDKSGKLIGYYN